LTEEEKREFDHSVFNILQQFSLFFKVESDSQHIFHFKFLLSHEHLIAFSLK